MESIDKLLSRLRAMDADNLVADGNGVYTPDVRHHIISAEIKREISERYMELPVDADGVPLRYEDYVESTEDVLHRKWHVVGYSLCGVECLLETDDEEYEKIETIRTSWLRHVKARTIEDVLEDFGIECDEQYPDKPRRELINEYASEIRGLL